MTASLLSEAEIRAAAEAFYMAALQKMAPDVPPYPPHGEEIAKFQFKEGFSEGHAFALAACAKREELWREYVGLLGVELHSLVGLAIAHGWQGNPSAYENGKRLRAALGIEPYSPPVPASEVKENR